MLPPRLRFCKAYNSTRPLPDAVIEVLIAVFMLPALKVILPEPLAVRELPESKMILGALRTKLTPD